MFRFTIRELLLLNVIAALAVGWTMSAQENQRLRMENKRVQNANETIWRAYAELKDVRTPIDDYNFNPPYERIIRMLTENPGKPQSGRKGN